MSRKKEITEAYQMLYDFHKIMEDGAIKYFMYGETLNDLINFKGIIPTESLLYVGMLKKEFKKVLNSAQLFKNCGYALSKVDGIYVVCGPLIKIVLCAFKKSGSSYYIKYNTRELFSPHQYIKSSEMGYKKIKIGKLQLYVLKGAKSYLARYYKNIEGGKPDFVPTIKRGCKKEGSPRGKKLFEKLGIITDVKTVKRGCTNKFAGKKTESFFINCGVHYKRKEKFLRHLRASGIKSCRQACVNGKAFTRKDLCKWISEGIVDPDSDNNPIEIAISLSHYNVWKRFLATDAEYLLVFEDDSEIHPDFAEMLNKTLKALKKNKKVFDVLWLWSGNWAGTHKYAEKVLKVDDKITIMKETRPYVSGTVSYVITRKFAKYLMAQMFPILYPIDAYMGDEAFRENHGNSFFVKMTHNVEKGCYLSPFFVGEEWICGGDAGTGVTTQEYKAEKIDALSSQCGKIK